MDIIILLIPALLYLVIIGPVTIWLLVNRRRRYKLTAQDEYMFAALLRGELDDDRPG